MPTEPGTIPQTTTTIPTPTPETSQLAIKDSDCLTILSKNGWQFQGNTYHSVDFFLGACGRILLEESGTVDLRHITGRCTVSIGRPLDEVIHVTVESSNLDCKKSEYNISSRYWRKCEQVERTELTTRTNVLLVGQKLLTPGNGVVLTYRSQKNTKKNCDIQLFAPSGVFENPTTPNSNHTCRVLINAPPAVKIRIQALHIGLTFNIRDMDVLKTNVFKGQQLFLWRSSGNMAEVEFHGDYLHSKGSFRHQWTLKNSTMN
uniref:CUB domain-containing protein n=1 Tax=Myripristis murdjan TaxID=586833 RepID=A0A668AGP4_9TELE